MAYVIAEPCIGTKDTACVDACPVDCIHPKKDEAAFATAELLYIDPVDCIDCGQLAQIIVDYQDRTDAAKACFTKLVGEPAALTARLAAAMAAIDAINAATNADPAKTDLKMVYAQAVVTQRHIDRIWNGFDQTHDFVDCLCCALTCWSNGCAAVSLLTGAKAVCDCEAHGKADRCEHLKTNTVDEILAMYDKLGPPHDDCPPDPPDPCPKPDDSCPDDDDDDTDVCDKCGQPHHPQGPTQAS